MNRWKVQLWGWGLSGLVVATPVWAHGGEDHDHEAPAPVLSQPVQPRAVAQSDDFELVAVLGASELTVYLDRADSNEPVSGAHIEIESDGFKAEGVAQGEGVYGMPAGALAHPGRHALTITVESDAGADLLDAALVVPQAASGTGDTSIGIWHRTPIWAKLAALSVIVVGLVAGGRMRRQPREEAQA
ncbi:MAG: hypothetical protein KGI52_01895 [Burkholderiales bacterium]|nr:hypothetical protein [Burkholderiales bacterium]